MKMAWKRKRAPGRAPPARAFKPCPRGRCAQACGGDANHTPAPAPGAHRYRAEDAERALRRALHLGEGPRRRAREARALVAPRRREARGRAGALRGLWLRVRSARARLQAEPLPELPLGAHRRAAFQHSVACRAASDAVSFNQALMLPVRFSTTSTTTTCRGGSGVVRVR